MPFFSRKGPSLSEFVRGIVQALTDGQQAIAHSREQHLKHHMDEGDDDVFRPKMIDIELSEGRRISVPEYSMMQVNTIGIHSAKVSCSCRIVDIRSGDDPGDKPQDGQPVKEKSGKMSIGDKHATFIVQPSSGGRNSFELQINFMQRDPSESENRLVESLDSLVTEQIDHPIGTSDKSDGSVNPPPAE